MLVLCVCVVLFNVTEFVCLQPSISWDVTATSLTEHNGTLTPQLLEDTPKAPHTASTRESHTHTNTHTVPPLLSFRLELSHMFLRLNYTVDL